MTILFYGDPHGNFEPLIEAVNKHRPEAVIILGDLQSQTPLHETLGCITGLTDVWFIHGNHDTDSNRDYLNLFESKLAHKNLNGRVEKIAGLKVAGLGAVFRGKVWYPKDEEAQPQFKSRADYKKANGLPNHKTKRYLFGMPRVQHSTIWPEDYYTLDSLDADVLVSHEAPSCHHNGFNQIDLLAESLGVSSIFHGHHHQDYQSVLTMLKGDINVHGVANTGIKDLAGTAL